MKFRASTKVLSLLTVAVLMFLATVVGSELRFSGATQQTRARADLVTRLKLTDAALTTESSYGRHRSLADPRAAFQEHPFAFDLFPGGAILPPAAHALVDRPSALPD